MKLTKEFLEQFDKNQLQVILDGIKAGVNVLVYARPEFNGGQMSQIILGLKQNLNVSVYAKPEFNNMQMIELRTGLLKGLNVSNYAKPEICAGDMRLARLTMQQDLERYKERHQGYS